MIEAPAAVLKSMWRKRVMTGTTMIPPPRPEKRPGRAGDEGDGKQLRELQEEGRHARV